MHPPSPRRLAHARELGDVAVSRRVLQCASFTAALLVLPWTLRMSLASCRDQVWRTLDEVRAHSAPALGASSPPEAWARAFGPWPRLTLAPLLAAAAASLVLGCLQTRGLFTLRPLFPDWARVGPRGGRFFSREAAARTGTQCVGGALMACALLALAVRWLPSFSVVFGEERHALGLALKLPFTALCCACGVLIILGAVDWAWAQKLYLVRWQMSDREVEREKREAFGHPEVRQARRDQHAATVQGLSLASATALICSGARAIALRYRVDEGAPRVCVKGVGALGYRLISQGAALGLPLVHHPDALDAAWSAEEGQTVSSDAYDAVADALSRAMRELPAGRPRPFILPE